MKPGARGSSEVLGKLGVLLNVRLKSEYLMKGSLLVHSMMVGDGNDILWP